VRCSATPRGRVVVVETSVEILEPGDRRAKAIVNELILRGVEPARLVSTGALHPERSNDPAPIFLILKRSSD
jgi:hypothetical protein